MKKVLWNLFAGSLSLTLLSACLDTDKNFSSEQRKIVKNLNLEEMSAKKKVDILFIVDNSTSMIPDREDIGIQFQNFISHISGSDYRIGFINSDVSSEGYEDVEGFYGNLKAVGENGEIYIDSSMGDPASLFNSAIINQENSPCTAKNQWCHEEPLKAILKVVEKANTRNSGFFRNNAQFVPIILADEDEASDGTNAIDPYDVVEFLEEYFAFGGDSFTSFVIAIPPNDQECLTAQQKESRSGRGAAIANVLWEFGQLTGGFNVSICDPQLGLELSKISEVVRSVLVYKNIPLEFPVDYENIEVRVIDSSGKVLDIGWKVAEGYMSFHQTPPEGSRVEVSYIK